MIEAKSPGELVTLRKIAREWLRLGVIGFAGPPTHISMLRALCVQKYSWIEEHDFEDAIATTNLLPGPASTQLAIYCAWRLRGYLGALIGGLCFIVPGLILIVFLAAVFLAKHPPQWILGAALGAGAGVPAVAISAAYSLVAASRERMGLLRAQNLRWVLYAVIGAAASATLGSYLVLLILGCGIVEIAIRRGAQRSGSVPLLSVAPFGLLAVGAAGGIGALSWVALKVGALSYGGGFVIIPLMHHDAVSAYHWMNGTQFLNAVALGQITPGPVVQTVAVVGYAADGIRGALIAAAFAFAPSFLFILGGARHFAQIRGNDSVRSFLIGAGPCVIGAIAGSAIPLGLSVTHLWQIPVLAGAALWLFLGRRSVVLCLVLAGLTGALIALCGVA